MIDLVCQWYRAHEGEMAARGIVSHLTVGPPDRPKRAIWVDLEVAEGLARLTVWDSGEAELERADLRNEQPTVEHLRLASPEDLEAVMTRLVDHVYA
jgi:hypothetical protein